MNQRSGYPAGLQRVGARFAMAYAERTGLRPAYLVLALLRGLRLPVPPADR